MNTLIFKRLLPLQCAFILAAVILQSSCVTKSYETVAAAKWMYKDGKRVAYDPDSGDTFEIPSDAKLTGSPGGVSKIQVDSKMYTICNSPNLPTRSVGGKKMAYHPDEGGFVDLSAAEPYDDLIRVKLTNGNTVYCYSGWDPLIFDAQLIGQREAERERKENEAMMLAAFNNAAGQFQRDMERERQERERNNAANTRFQLELMEKVNGSQNRNSSANVKRSGGRNRLTLGETDDNESLSLKAAWQSNIANISHDFSSASDRDRHDAEFQRMTDEAQELDLKSKNLRNQSQAAFDEAQQEIAKLKDELIRTNRKIVERYTSNSPSGTQAKNEGSPNPWDKEVKENSKHYNNQIDQKRRESNDLMKESQEDALELQGEANRLRNARYNLHKSYASP